MSAWRNKFRSFTGCHFREFFWMEVLSRTAFRGLQGQTVCMQTDSCEGDDIARWQAGADRCLDGVCSVSIKARRCDADYLLMAY